MDFNINFNISGVDKSLIANLLSSIKDLSYMYLNETFKGNKVAFYYKDIHSGISISYNKSICFYAASAIKIIACLMILNEALEGKLNLSDEILITKDDLKQDTGIIKFQNDDTYYSLEELVRLTIVESDNTAYLKLVELLGKDNIKAYGNSLGATNTMVGKETDSFGTINCDDMIIYWQEVKKFIDSNNKYSERFKEWLINPSVKFITDKSIDNMKFVRKYGSWDIAYHEAGYVDGEKPFYMIILTQLNKFDYKDVFINNSAKELVRVHKNLCNLLERKND